MIKRNLEPWHQVLIFALALPIVQFLILPDIDRYTVRLTKRILQRKKVCLAEYPTYTKPATKEVAAGLLLTVLTHLFNATQTYLFGFSGLVAEWGFKTLI